ncbi:MAG: nucleoside deaminase [Candidatus Doudnabacteria bacterium]|nr:nucleoside deaminase [Candidatus Doudnabacteria bacterium]
MTEDEHFMMVALEEAKKGMGPKRFGAVVVCNGKVMAKACSTTYEDNDGTQHAEIKAISKACRALKSRHLPDCVLYSTAEPCMMCTGAALWEKIRRIVYGMSRKDALEFFEHSNHWSKSISELVPKDCEVVSGVLRGECIEILKQTLKG